MGKTDVFPGNLQRWYIPQPQLSCHGFVPVEGLLFHFLLHLPSSRIMFSVGEKYPFKNMGAHAHRQQAVTFICQIVANKIICKAGHTHISVTPWQASLSHPWVLDLAVCCRQQGMTGGDWSLKFWQPLLRCELCRIPCRWKTACARCSGF